MIHTKCFCWSVFLEFYICHTFEQLVVQTRAIEEENEIKMPQFINFLSVNHSPSSNQHEFKTTKRFNHTKS